MYHFGEARVNTPDDLGAKSENPTHPELLDTAISLSVAPQWCVTTNYVAPAGLRGFVLDRP
jgi:hypothetical protein